jgi:hypothetical protein
MASQLTDDARRQCVLPLKSLAHCAESELHFVYQPFPEQDTFYAFIKLHQPVTLVSNIFDDLPFYRSFVGQIFDLLGCNT